MYVWTSYIDINGAPKKKRGTIWRQKQNVVRSFISVGWKNYCLYTNLMFTIRMEIGDYTWEEGSVNFYMDGALRKIRSTKRVVWICFWRTAQSSHWRPRHQPLRLPSGAFVGDILFQALSCGFASSSWRQLVIQWFENHVQQLEHDGGSGSVVGLDFFGQPPSVLRISDINCEYRLTICRF